MSGAAARTGSYKKERIESWYKKNRKLGDLEKPQNIRGEN